MYTEIGREMPLTGRQAGNGVGNGSVGSARRQRASSTFPLPAVYAKSIWARRGWAKIVDGITDRRSPFYTTPPSPLASTPSFIPYCPPTVLSDALAAIFFFASLRCGIYLVVVVVVAASAFSSTLTCYR